VIFFPKDVLNFLSENYSESIDATFDSFIIIYTMS